jgi:hypothetical protein
VGIYLVSSPSPSKEDKHSFLKLGDWEFFSLSLHSFRKYMIQSMTGFGKTAIINQKTVEVKSLNSKGLDLNVRMPSLYREMELGYATKLH